MGMYTELVLKCGIKEDIPDDVEAVLHYLFNGGTAPSYDKLPTHRFFQTTRWSMIGRSNSYYHVPWACSKYYEGRIFSRSDLKNYDDEIMKFIDWLRPYIDEFPEQCIGWMWYEEDNAPTLIYAKSGD